MQYLEGKAMATSFGEKFGNFIRGIPILGAIVRRLSRRSSSQDLDSDPNSYSSRTSSTTVSDTPDVNPAPLYSDIVLTISSAQLDPDMDYPHSNAYSYIAEITGEVNDDNEITGEVNDDNIATPEVAIVKKQVATVQKPKIKKTKEERQKKRENRTIQFSKDVNRFTDVNSTLPMPSAAKIAEIAELNNTVSPQHALRLAMVDDFVEHVYNNAKAAGKSNVNKEDIYAAVRCLQQEMQGALFDVLGGCTFAKDGKQIPFQELRYLNNDKNDKVVTLPLRFSTFMRNTFNRIFSGFGDKSQILEIPINNQTIKLSIEGLKISYVYQHYMMHQDIFDIDLNPDVVNRDILVTQVTTIDFGCLADGTGRGFKPGSDAITQTLSINSLSNSVKFSLPLEMESVLPNVRNAIDSEYVVVDHPGIGLESEKFVTKPTPKERSNFFTWFMGHKSDAKAPGTVSDETNKSNHGNNTVSDEAKKPNHGNKM